MSKKQFTGEDHGSFIKRFKLKMPPLDIARIDYAYDMAKHGHRNQFRESGERYFEHVRATALIMVDELGITDVEMIMVALLHDMLEDTFLLTPDRIKITFGERVARMIYAISKPRKDDPRFATNEERQEWYFKQIAHASVEEKIVKLADRLHNLRTLNQCSKEKQLRKIEETKVKYLPLLNDVKNDHPKIADYLGSSFTVALKELEEELKISAVITE